MKGFRHPDVGVQWSIGLTHSVVHDRQRPHVSPNETADGRPVSMGWKELAILIGIHVITEVLLLLIGDAFDGLSFDFGACKGWQQERSQYRDNANNHQKLDQGKGSPAVHRIPCTYSTKRKPRLVGPKKDDTAFWPLRA